MVKIFTFEEISRDSSKFKEVFEYIAQYGRHCMAYSILQPKINYFILDNVGIIAYVKYFKNSNRRYVLSDPLCMKADRSRLIESFFKVFPNSSFVQVSKEVAKLLYDHFGLYATPMGTETTIDLNKFDITGDRQKNLRNNIRNCKGKIKVCEDTEIALDSSILKIISKRWIIEKKKDTKELRFLARPLPSKKERGVRRFYAFQNNKPVGFIVFNPICDSHYVIGYTADIIRTLKDVPRGTADYMLYLAIKKFKREGILYLSLGLSPLANVELDDLNLSDALTRKIFSLIYKKGSKLYHFNTLAEHKQQFEGLESNVYFSHSGRLPLLKIFQIFKICNIL